MANRRLAIAMLQFIGKLHVNTSGKGSMNETKRLQSIVTICWIYNNNNFRRSFMVAHKRIESALIQFIWVIPINNLRKDQRLQAR